MVRSEAVIDLDAIRANVGVLRAATLAQQTRAQVMALVTADCYGQGLLPVARAALEGGATWLGTASIAEALALRQSGISVPIFVQLWAPEERDALVQAVGAEIDLAVSTRGQLDVIRTASNDAEEMARVHLAVDTGLGHSGCAVSEWPDLLDAAAKAQMSAEVVVIGVWSELVHGSAPEDPANDAQLLAFHLALQTAARHQIVPHVRHLANSAGTLAMPGTHFDLVRAGTAVYGLPPVPGRDFGLVPAFDRVTT